MKKKTCRNCGEEITWCAYITDPKTGRKRYARTYGYRAWRLCAC